MTDQRRAYSAEYVRHMGLINELWPVGDDSGPWAVRLYNLDGTIARESILPTYRGAQRVATRWGKTGWIDQRIAADLDARGIVRGES